METKKRNRVATTQRIVNALEQILLDEGIQGISMNAIAEKAAVSKMLIYRYFGGLEGLLEYYIRRGQLVPHFTPAWLEQLQPVQPKDLAPFWSAHTIQLFRQFRQVRTARELLKLSVKEADSLAEVASRSLDAELTLLVNQLAFIKGVDHQAISAVIFGALSYLTIQAQLNRPVIGLDMRSEAGWQRIEESVRVIYHALSKLAAESSSVQLLSKPANRVVQEW
ncbi:TetR family transcriptional regulator [Spirosoma sp. HMF4905]|uniref:TetR family transcriptional regulator n=1 Tax=Spirosoma arboris TaxID=2682092 RepID=A0A7K1SNY8_9BACT|nr:TetR/AcrR family transcriptional regulator [Spirosoma arboris]MVM35509.1 TetR family transcriptional regulator [Spirosoma arboris]